MLRILLVQTQDQIAQFLARFFEERGDVVASVQDLGKAATYVSEFKPDLMVLDLHFIGNEWNTFLRLVRLEYPDLKIIVTNKYPDLQREMRAREQGIKVFVRYPFTQYWLNRALKSFNFPVETKHHHAPAGQTQPPRRMLSFPVRIKITLPYLVLALSFALVSGYIVSQFIMENAQQRFFNRLTSSRVQGADWMVRKEDDLLKSLRLIANTQGLGERVESADSDGLRSLVLPLAINANDEVVQILNINGTSLLTLQRPPQGSGPQYTYSRGDASLAQASFVRSILAGEADIRGDKFAGLVPGPANTYFYVAGPIFNQAGQRVGALLVGNSMAELTHAMQTEILSDVSFYDLGGQPLASTLAGSGGDSFPVGERQLQLALAGQNGTDPLRTLTQSNSSYIELLGAWEVRGGEKLGLLGVAMPQSFLPTSGQSMRWQMFILITLGTLLVIGMGLYLSGVITSPLQRLVTASNQVSQGKLDVKVDVQGGDEVAALAQSFNQMVTGLQEGAIYRDLLGHTVSGSLRDQLRETLSSGSLKLEGQEMVGTVLYSDIREFNTLAETVEPARVFDWLNEYFSLLVPIVNNHGGVVNQFDGDAMLSFFGILPAVLTPQESAAAACRAGLEMVRAANELNGRRFKRGNPAMISGIGINTGVMLAGGLGTSDRLHYTIIGDTINTTQRLESLTREIYPGNGVLISHATFTALGPKTSDFYIESLGRRIVKGKTDRILVYRLQPLEAETEVKVTI